MNFYIDESGNTGDLARTGPGLDFGGQAVFSLTAIGMEDETALTKELNTLREKHHVQATELKLSKILRRKPAFALDAVEILVKNKFPFFIEIVDKKYQLAMSITNGFIWPPYFNTKESQDTVYLRNIFADYLYSKLSSEVFFAFIKCMNHPSNENTAAYFDLLREFVDQDSRDLAKAVVSQIIESKEDFRLMIKQEGDKAHLRFLPIPDVGKRGQEIWLLPNFSSFTNIYARMNLFLSRNLEGTRIFHDEQAHFDEIISAAKSQVERANVRFDDFTLSHSDYTFEQISDLFFKTSPESTGVQLADIVAGLCMRWYQAHLNEEEDTDVLDKATDVLLHHSDPKKGVGINVVGPHNMAQKLFGFIGY